MNQQDVKRLLLSIKSDVKPFELIFSGKQSAKVNGLYKPDTEEIVIHNRNFSSEGPLIYTAIHEFAHHIHFTTSPVPVTSRSHTTEFRSILHNLLRTAEEIGVYQNVFATNPDFVALTRRVQDEFLTRHGAMMKELGSLLLEAERLCREHHARFEDYVERVLLLDTSTANTLIKLHHLDLPPRLGYENMRTLAGIGNSGKREAAKEAFERGESPDMVKHQFKAAKPAREGPVETILAERERIERTIEGLKRKLRELDERLEEYGDS